MTTTPSSVLKVFLFTDLVGSTEMKRRLSDARAAQLIAAHDALFRRCMAECGGTENEDAGDGFSAIFDRPSDALRCALDFQEGLRGLEAPEFPKSRIGLHLGEIAVLDGSESGKTKYVGLALDTAARVMGLAQGGQVLLTRAAFDSARQHIESTAGGAPVVWLAHGPYRFKGVDEPMEIFEAGVEGLSALSPPPNSEKATRAIAPGDEETLGWRPAMGLDVPNRPGWRLERKLGEGGFGEVWVAASSRTREQRTFKFCFKAERLRTLKRELTLFRLLKETLGDRPDISRLHDVQLETAPFYLEMDYTAGGDFAAWADRQGGIGAVRIERRLQLIAQVAEALAAAHSVGVIHKDVKPTNVLIEEKKDGTFQARLTDFGIGQIVNRSALDEAGVTAEGFTTFASTMLTEVSSRTGTRLYMAPELLAGKPATIQSDIYALGVMLYQVVVGDLVRPLGQGWERDVADEFLREDIAACVDGEAWRRPNGAAEVAQRLRSLETRRAEREAALEEERRSHEQAVRQSKAADRARLRTRVLMGFSGIAVLLLAVILGVYVRETKLREEALAERNRADKRAEEAEHEQYIAAVQFADACIADGRFSLADTTLIATTPSRRGWEWGYLMKEIHSELLELRGHGSSVFSVAFSPDGTRIATTSRDGTAKIWDAASGRELATLRGHGSLVRCVAFSPDGTRIATGAYDNTAKIWDAASARELVTLQGHSSGINSVAFGADGTRIATGSQDVTARIWDAASGRELATLEGHAREVTSVAYSPDGTRIATGSYDGNTKLWDAVSGLELATIGGRGSEVYGLAFSPDGTRIATGCYNRTTRIWDAVSGQELATLRGHSLQVNAVAFSPDGTRIATGAGDYTAKVWEAAGGPELATFTGHGSGVISVAFSPDGTRIATSALDDDTAKIWELANRQEPAILWGHGMGVGGVSISPDGTRIATGSFDGTAKIWETASAHELATLRGHSSEVRCVAFSPDGTRIATGSYDRTAKIWEASGRELATLKGHEGQVMSVAFSPDGTRMATGSRDNTAKIWEAASARELATLKGHGSGVLSVAFSPDGTRIVTASGDGTAKMWDAVSARELATLKQHYSEVSAVAFSPDGTRIATASGDGTAKIWEAASGRELATLKGHGLGVNSVVFNPDGTRIATGSSDKTAKIWEAASGRELATLKGHGYAVYSVAFSADGTRIVTGSDDNTAKIWDSIPWTDTGFEWGEQLRRWQVARLGNLENRPKAPFPTHDGSAPIFSELFDQPPSSDRWSGTEQWRAADGSIQAIVGPRELPTRFHALSARLDNVSDYAIEISLKAGVPVGQFSVLLRWRATERAALGVCLLYENGFFRWCEVPVGFASVYSAFRWKVAEATRPARDGAILRVEARGNTFTAFLDGEFLGQFVTDNHPEGTVGLGYWPNSRESPAQIDSFSVYALAPNAQ